MFDLRAPEKLTFSSQQLIYARFSLSRTEPVPFGQFPLLLGLLLRVQQSHSPSNRPDRADRRCALIARPLPFCANDGSVIIEDKGSGISLIQDLAAASLREGLEETLTVMRLGLPANLERVLSSTNLIENLFSRVREIGRRVKRWQSGTMVLRWTAAGVLEAQRGFRKLAGYRALPALVAALRAHDAQLDRTEGKLDTARNAA